MKHVRHVLGQRTAKSALSGVRDGLQDSLLLSPVDFCGVISFFVFPEDLGLGAVALARWTTLYARAAGEPPAIDRDLRARLLLPLPKHFFTTR
jgi:hypothetical protein